MHFVIYLLICGFLLVMNLMMHLMRPDPALSLLCALILYRTKKFVIDINLMHVVIQIYHWS